MSSHRDAPLGFTRFSTREVAPEQRIARWEAHNAKALVGLRARPAGASALQAAAVNLSLPRLGLARVGAAAHTVQRDERDIAAHPVGGAVVYFALKGEGTFLHRGGRELIAPGQAILCHADQGFSRSFAHGLQEMALTIPRDVLQQMIGATSLTRPLLFDFRAGPDFRAGSEIAAVDPVARTLAADMSGALSGRPVDWDALETRLLDLVGELLEGHRQPVDGPAAARGIIERHHARPSLSASQIASALGVSVRQLSRVLGEAGTSVPQAILEARLASAHRMLVDPVQAAASMAEVAARAGFSSPAQFSRSYRSRYGLPPLHHRRDLTGPASG